MNTNINSCDCVTMKARVTKVCPCYLMVCDVCTGQEVQVNSSCACCYCVGDCVCIHYNGAMTNSLPPQISAESICHLDSCC